jgi:RNA polymerase sigma-70 factor (ECF subfamily)
MYELQWADTVLTEARQRLQGECEVSGKGELFQAIKDYIMEDAASGDYHSVAAELKMTPGAVAVTVHRLRQRLGKILKEEVSQTVASPEETEAELRHLCKVYGSLPASMLNPDQAFS